MSKRARLEQPMYRVWRSDDEEDSGKEYGAISVEDAARLYADYCHRHRDGWEWTWPIVFFVRNLQTEEPFAVSVSRDTVPEFFAAKPLSFEGFKPAHHVYYGGAAMCEDARLDGRPWPTGHTHVELRVLVDHVVAGSPPETPLTAITCERCKKRALQQLPLLVEARERAEQRKLEEARQAEIDRATPPAPKKPIKDVIREMAAFIEAMINDLAQHESDPSMMDGHRAKLAEWKKVLG